MTARLEVMHRIGPTSDTLTARYDVGGGSDTGDVTVTLTSGLYSLTGLLAHISTRLQADVHANMGADEGPGGLVRIGSGAATTAITWDHPALRDWLGFTGDLSGSTRYTAPAQSPGLFIASQPWAGDDPLGWRWHLKRWSGPRQRGGSVKVGRVGIWKTTAFALRDEVDQLRGVLSYLARGIPVRWYRDASVTTAWSWSNWFGYVDATLHPDQAAYVDQWARGELRYHLRVDLELLEFAE